MTDQPKRVDLRLGEIALSVQGFDDPAKPLRQVLRLLQRVVEETPEIGNLSLAIDDAVVESIMEDLQARLDLPPESLEVTPGLIVATYPDAAADAGPRVGVGVVGGIGDGIGGGALAGAAAAGPAGGWDRAAAAAAGTALGGRAEHAGAHGPRDADDPDGADGPDGPHFPDDAAAPAQEEAPEIVDADLPAALEASGRGTAVAGDWSGDETAGDAVVESAGSEAGTDAEDDAEDDADDDARDGDWGDERGWGDEGGAFDPPAAPPRFSGEDLLGDAARARLAAGEDGFGGASDAAPADAGARFAEDMTDAAGSRADDPAGLSPIERLRAIRESRAEARRAAAEDRIDGLGGAAEDGAGAEALSAGEADADRGADEDEDGDDPARVVTIFDAPETAASSAPGMEDGPETDRIAELRAADGPPQDVGNLADLFDEGAADRPEHTTPAERDRPGATEARPAHALRTGEAPPLDNIFAAPVADREAEERPHAPAAPGFPAEPGSGPEREAVGFNIFGAPPAAQPPDAPAEAEPGEARTTRLAPRPEPEDRRGGRDAPHSDDDRAPANIFAAPDADRAPDWSGSEPTPLRRSGLAARADETAVEDGLGTGGGTGGGTGEPARLDTAGTTPDFGGAGVPDADPSGAFSRIVHQYRRDAETAKSAESAEAAPFETGSWPRVPDPESAGKSTAQPAGGIAVTPAELARLDGAATVTDLLACAAAWLSIVKGQARFARRDVMAVFDEIPGEHPRSLEARIKGYGKLVRNGVLVLVDDGLFALSDEEQARYSRLLGG